MDTEKKNEVSKAKVIRCKRLGEIGDFAFFPQSSQFTSTTLAILVLNAGYASDARNVNMEYEEMSSRR